MFSTARTFAAKTPLLLFAVFLILLTPSGTKAQSTSLHLSANVRGSEVSLLQQRLSALGYFTGPQTGYFGPLTEAAVAAFQRTHGIAPIGIVGPLTRAALNAASTTSVLVPSSLDTIQVSSTSPTGVATVDLLTRSLELGSNGNDVLELQRFLKAQGFFTYPSTTTHFGSLTQAAVAAFQRTHGIAPIGIVGPLTRALINSLFAQSTASGISSSETATASSSQPAAPLPTSSGAPSNSNGGGGSALVADTSGAPIDTTAPTISSITASSTATTTVQIAWTTNEPSTSQVDYGLTTAYGSSTSLNASLLTSHFVTITGLTASSTYYFRVKSADAHGNVASSAQQTVTTFVYDYYVDSVSGSDSNSGTSPSAPFATLTPLTTMSTLRDGTHIGLKRGSTFTSELNITGNNLTVEAYGSGAMPYIDARDVVAGFTPTSGKANVYQATITLPNSIKSLGNIFENEKILVQYNNLNSVASNIGSAYVVDWTAATSTLYIHPSDNSDPSVSSNIYHYSRRLYAISINGNFGTVRGIRTRGQAHQDGSISMTGTDALIDSDRIEDGARHSLYMRDRGVIMNSYFYRAQNDLEGSSNFVVWNQPDVSTMTGTTTNTTFDAGDTSTSTSPLSAMEAHGSSAGQLALAFNHTDDTFIGVIVATNDNAANITLTRPLFTNAGAVSFGNVGATVTINNIVASSTINKRFFNASSGGGTLAINDSTFDAFGIGDGLFKSTPTTNDMNVTLTNVHINVKSTLDTNPRYLVYIKRGTLTMNNSSIGPTVGPLFDEFIKVGDTATGAVLGNNNVYPYGAHWDVNGTNYFTLSAWQTASSQDLASTYATLTPVFSDSFNRADQNLDVATGWTLIGGTSAQAAVRSNQLAYIGSSAAFYAIADSGSLNEWARYIVATTAPQFSTITVRATDQNNFVSVNQNTTQFALNQYVANVFSAPGGGTQTPAVGDEVVLSAYGNQFIIYVNKRALGKAVITNSAFKTSTKAGIAPRFTASNPAIDDFSYGVIP